MKTPPRLVVQNGTRANDGTGDTLRDAADKINQNFERLWHDTYNSTEVRPGRGFVASVDSTAPDSGGFSIRLADISEDSDPQVLKISTWDTDEKAYSFAGSDSWTADLTIWELDSGTIDEYSLVSILRGTVSYNTNHWNFKRTSVIAATGLIDSGDSYYISLQGIW